MEWIVVRVGDADWAVPRVLDSSARREIEEGRWEAEEFGLARQAFGSDDVVIEAGSCFGWIAVQLAQVVGCRVRTYEAHPDLFEIARRNVADHGGELVECCAAALVDSGSTASFHRRRNPWAGSLVGTARDDPPISVAARPLASEIAAQGATGLMLDVEGAEVAMLARGALPASIANVVVEWHPPAADPAAAVANLQTQRFTREAAIGKDGSRIDWWSRRLTPRATLEAAPPP